MSRSDHVIGLNHRAQEMLRLPEPIFLYEERTVRIHSNGKKEEFEPRKIYQSYADRQRTDKVFVGLCDSEYMLHKYQLPDGRVFNEEVQESPWSSGPHFFLALKDDQDQWIQDSMWTPQEIELYIGNFD